MRSEAIGACAAETPPSTFKRWDPQEARQALRGGLPQTHQGGPAAATTTASQRADLGGDCGGCGGASSGSSLAKPRATTEASPVGSSSSSRGLRATPGGGPAAASSQATLKDRPSGRLLSPPQRQAASMRLDRAKLGVDEDSWLARSAEQPNGRAGGRTLLPGQQPLQQRGLKPHTPTRPGAVAEGGGASATTGRPTTGMRMAARCLLEDLATLGQSSSAGELGRSKGQCATFKPSKLPPFEASGPTASAAASSLSLLASSSSSRAGLSGSGARKAAGAAAQPRGGSGAAVRSSSYAGHDTKGAVATPMETCQLREELGKLFNVNSKHRRREVGFLPQLSPLRR